MNTVDAAQRHALYGLLLVLADIAARVAASTFGTEEEAA
jgi:hypothetical protein